MEILVFIAVIVALIVVHEFGHFIAAKLSGMRVDEFGLGYPPRALTLGKIGETEYTLNWLPFGGFVKIYGEDPGTTTTKTRLVTGHAAEERAFYNKNRFLQAIVLVAGIAMNLVFAYVLITSALVMGTPRALMPSELATATHLELAVANVLPGSPAARAGLLAGDSVMSAEDTMGQWHATDPVSFSAFVAASEGNPITLSVKHDGSEHTVTATPVSGIVKADPSRFALGVEVATIGVVPVSFGAALTEGASLTWDTTVLTAQGLWHFFYGVFTLSADLSQVAGPIGIAGAVGSASAQGLGDLLSIMAVISINLALINLIPVPALDGGRLLFVLIESVIRRPIKPSVARAINAVGFVALVLLMVVVTAHDIFRIVG
ncbi:MAG TPA: M50 family metallopeptidase [Candidatus Paceibacterota bacterium]|nr:M50 family metallopeptidase [Candidatus Paceibacterota bacterium]